MWIHINTINNNDRQSTVRVANDKQSTDGIATSSQPSTPETTSESTTSTSDPIEKHDHMSTNGHDGNSPHASALSMIASEQKMQSQRFSSVIWKLITLQEDCQTCVCNICKLELVYGKSSYHLLAHLRLKHPYEFNVEEEKLCDEDKLSRIEDMYKNDYRQFTIGSSTDKQSTVGTATSSQPSTGSSKTASDSTTSASDPIEKHDPVSPIGYDGNSSVASRLSSTFETKQKKQSKRFLSVCWKLITLQEDGQTAVCNICKVQLVYNRKRTTNLLRHLRLRHPFEFALKEKQLSRDRYTDTYNINNVAQSTINIATDTQSNVGIATSSQPSLSETVSESTTSTSDAIEKHDPVSPIGYDGNASVASRLSSTFETKQKKQSKGFLSVCWKLITLQEDGQTCVCNICKVQLVYNKKSTTHLLRHLRLKHPFEFAAEVEKRFETKQSKRFLSVCWKLITLQVDGRTCVCNICKFKLLYTKKSTTNLLQHLRLRHPFEYAAKVEKQSRLVHAYNNDTQSIVGFAMSSQPRTLETVSNSIMSTADPIAKHDPISPSVHDSNSTFTSSSSTVFATEQLTIAAAEERTINVKPESLRKKEIDSCILKLVTTDLQPLSVVENTAFRELLTKIDPEYEIVSRKRLDLQLLPERYHAERGKLLQEMEAVEYVSISTDFWTSRQAEGYMTLTAHFVNTQWKLCSRVLSTTLVEGSYTAENLASVMRHVFQTWGISKKVTTVTTDNTANVSAAVELLQVTHQACFAHTLNLAVKEAIQNAEDVFAAKMKVKDIVGLFHHSTLTNSTLKEVHKTCQTVPKKLKVDVDTRWNSTYDMLQLYLDQHQQVTTALCLTGNPDMCITDEELDLLEEAMVILEPFYEATMELSTEIHTSASKIIPLIHQLLKFTARGVSALAKCLNAKLKERFNQVEAQNHLGVATILDPRFKRSGFPDQKSFESAAYKLKEKASAIVIPLAQEVPADDDADITNPSPAKKRSILWSSFDSAVKEKEIVFAHRFTASEREVRRHLETPCIPRDADPLDWWRDHVGANHRISCIAKDVLGIPATSVPSKMLFSEAGELIMRRRTNLKAKHVDMILFLNSLCD